MNLPNKLTMFRIVLVPIMMLVWLFPYASFGITFKVFDIGNTSVSTLNLIVLGIFVLASFTDMLDGKIARSRNLITTFGKFADPIADKLLVNTMLVILCSKGMLPAVPVVFMILRDTVVDGCRMLAAQNGVVVAAGMMGKLKTVLQMITIVIVLLNNIPFELVSIPMNDIMIWFTCLVSIASGLGYFRQVSSLIFKSI